ncbi:hypothetical protein [Metabacillus endolithicus]|uniref:Uncharacterized protein n=1 Tax=Metabacillus endolithicus TaxID=1535204 RepID=A0ABW5BWZ0_9BACI|nr:hypothetical protein [Metabacillus endolithicus]UPG64213.1 hypothetical protein MVE64_03525 [Metabacillus endolithicus]
MNKSLLLKVGASLLAVFLMAACNNTEDTEQEETNVEETEEGTEETEEGAEQTEEEAE